MNFAITPNITQSKNVQNNKLNILAFPPQKQNLPANSNLAPLARDTVSFGGKDKILKTAAGAVTQTVNGLRSEKVGGQFINDFNYSLAFDIVKDAEVPMGFFQNTLFRYLRKHISTDMGDDRIIQRLNFRIKSADSVYEKLNAIGFKAKEKARLDGRETFFATREDANNMLGDVIAGRIVLRDDSKKSVKKVLQILEQIVKDGKFKISEIENYFPLVSSVPENVVKGFRKDLGIKLDERSIKDLCKADYFSYADSKDIRSLADVCRTKFPDLVVKAGQDLPNGYQALHVSVILPDGSKAELQIIGRDVEVLKSIEDYVYKAKCHKKIKNAALAERLTPLGNDAETVLHSEHINYTRWAYIGQRLKDQQPFNKKTSEKFLTAPKSILDRGLGYNQLMTLSRKK